MNRTQYHIFIKGLHDSLCIVKLLKNQKSKKSLVPENGFVTEV